MDFFAQQDDARRRTGLLLIYYALAVAGIIVGIYLVLAALFAYAQAGDEPSPPLGEWIWHPELLAGVAIITLAIIGLGSLFKTLQLKQGGARVARLLGGRRVAPDSIEPLEQRLLHIVEEMAIASGIAVPDVYVLDSEPGINAFAAGFTPADAVIGVTSGALKQFSRDELQGVIAHEFSHIVHGDMRLNIKLMGVLHGIVLIAVLGYILMRSAFFSGGARRGSRDNKGNIGIAIVVLGLALVIIGYIGVFFANLIKSAVSRQREFLADASAVQFTRNPAGIAGALKRIAGYSHGARIRDVHAAEASHLFFGNALRAPLAGLLATHPPLQLRIRRLDPAFNPEIARMSAMPSSAPDGTPLEAGLMGLADGAAGTAQVAAQAGTLSAEHLVEANRVIDGLPESLVEAVHNVERARSVVYGLLMQSDNDLLERQMEVIGLDRWTRPDAVREATAVLRGVSRMKRLTLAELAAPALRQMPRESYAVFETTLKRIMAVDNKINPFEYALHRLLLRHVAPAFGKVDSGRVRYRDIKAVLPAATDVVLALAAWGSANERDARIAFSAGISKLTDKAVAYPGHLPSLDRVNEALTRLSQSAPSVKKMLLEACTACVAADGRLGPDQGELLRAVADALDCPMPPLRLAGTSETRD